MIHHLVAWCAKNKWLSLAITAALGAWAFSAMRRMPLDAIPDLSDTQVIIYSKWDRSPDQVEDQLTYPLIRSLLGAPKVKSIRGFSDFGYSYVYVIFEEGSETYWARSRVLENLAKIQGQLPAGATTELGPDASGVGWVYQYALTDKSGGLDLAGLRSLQDWKLRYELQSVPGVAEVASVGGFVRQLQVNVDPLRLQAAGLPLLELARAVRGSNLEMGARVLEFGGAEFMLRGRGYAKSAEDVGAAVVRSDARTGSAIRVRDLATVAWGPDMRRGITELNGEGEAPGGIVVMRQGANAPEVIQAVKARLDSAQRGLPKGVQIIPVYDRSELIARAIHTVKHELWLQMLIVSLVIALFLWHLPSAMIPILTLPVSVLLAFLPMHWLGISANIMSLAGIAVAIGAMVDASIVVVENSHKKLELWDAAGRKGGHEAVLIKAIQEVARPSFYSLLVIAVAFLPVFALTGQEGKLFKPLAYTKNLSMLVAAVLAITLDPALRLLLIRLKPFKFRHGGLSSFVNALLVGRLQKEEDNPVSRRLFRWYQPIAHAVLRHPRRTIGLALLSMALSLPVFGGLGREFMPELDEGDLLYMPTALPGMAASEAARLMSIQDKIIKSFPEVESVFGKAGRAETSTDVAPFSMFETTVRLKPAALWPRHESTMQLAARMNEKLKLAGMPNIWIMPIRNRLEMLSTGIRTPLGIKVLGSDLAAIQSTAIAIEAALKDVPGTRSAVAERAEGGYFVDVEWDREALGRYGISMEDAQMTLATAFGGDAISTAVIGRERYGIALRYKRELRESADDLKRVLLTPMNNSGMPGAAAVALGQLATVRRLEGPAMLRNEDGQLAAYVTVDVAGRDLGSYVDEAQAVIDRKVQRPQGVSLRYSGQYEGLLRARKTLLVVLPLTLCLVFFLIWMNSRSVVRTLIVMLAVPFSLIGALWLLYALGYSISVATWVGMIALMGLDAETGMFMLLYLELSYDEAAAKKKMNTAAQLHAAVMHGAVKRVRPKVMTVACAFIGLLPLMFATGSGADVMKHVAAPMVGGLVSSFALELAVYPAVFYLWKWHTEVREKAEHIQPSGFWKFIQQLG